MRYIGLFVLGILLTTNATFAGGSELAQIQSQIRQTEQKNKQLEQRVKTSDRDVADTKKKLVSAADKVSDLQEKRDKIQKNIAELDITYTVFLILKPVQMYFSYSCHMMHLTNLIVQK